MNKTDMSNPAPIYYLSTSLCFTKELDKLIRASTMREWKKRAEIRLAGFGAGGGRKHTQVKIYRRAVSCDRVRML